MGKTTYYISNDAIDNSPDTETDDDSIDATLSDDPDVEDCEHCGGKTDRRYYFCPWCGKAI